jgi:transposase InsO family protein
LAKYPTITKITAKLDTPHANNIVEACHKRFKNEILPVKHVETFQELLANLPAYQEAYNNMPHSFLLGQTPNEAIKAISFDKEAYITNLKANKKARKLANKALHCCKK